MTKIVHPTRGPVGRMREGATTEDYRNAIKGSDEMFSLGYEWTDKPHRLIYDLCGEIDHLNLELEQLRADALKHRAK